MRLNRFLIINPFGIGDVLFTTPVLRAIRTGFPDSFIGYWCNERTKELLENNPYIDEIFALSRGDIKKIYQRSIWQGIGKSIKLLSGIRKKAFDISLDFSLDYRYSLLTKFAGIKTRIGFNYKGRGCFLTDKIDIDGYHQKHIVEYYLELLEFIGIKPQDYRLQLLASEENKKKAAGILSGCGVAAEDLLIGIAPGGGASWGKDALIKHWPVLKFKELAEKIMHRLNAKIILLGDKSETGIAGTIVNSMAVKPIDLSGKLSLGELIAIIDNLDILIANDGGPLHIAVALGKKTVSFFGPADPTVYGPYPQDSHRHIVLRRDLECSPCYRNFRLRSCQKNRECLEKIDVTEAVDAAATLLHS